MAFSFGSGIFPPGRGSVDGGATVAPLLGIRLSRDSFDEGGSPGLILARLEAIGGTPPFTFALSSDPGGFFALSDARLLAGAVPMSAGASCPLGLSVTDGTGATVAQAFTISPRPQRQYKIAMSGFRQLNRRAAAAGGSAAATQWAVLLVRRTPAYWCKNPRFALPNYYTIEDSQTANEGPLANPYTLRRISLRLPSTGEVWTAGFAQNGGVVDPASAAGGIWSDPILTGWLPPNSEYELRICGSMAQGAELPSHYELRAGTAETMRFHITQSFDAQVDGGLSLVVAGSTAGNIAGYLPGPVYGAAIGGDGRPSILILGDSIGVGKGTPQGYANDDGCIGYMEMGAHDAAGSLRMPVGSTAIAGSAHVSYATNLTLLDRRINLLAQISAPGTSPFDVLWCEHGNNSLAAANTGPDPARYVERWAQTYVPTLDRFRQVFGREFEVWQSTMTQKVRSSDGLRTVTGQTVQAIDASDGHRFLLNDALMTTKYRGLFDRVFNSYAALAAAWNGNDSPTGNPDRDRFKVHPFTGTLAQAYASGNDLFVTVTAGGPPLPGLALSVGGKVRNVTMVTPQGGNVFRLTTTVASSSATYPASPVGTPVNGAYAADGDYVTGFAVHPSHDAHRLIAAAFVQFKEANFPRAERVVPL